MKKFTTTFFLLMAMVLLLPTELKAADVTLTFLVPQTNKGARLHAWLDDPDGDAKDVAFWEWNNNPTVGTNDGNSNFSETVSYNGTDYYSITKTVGNNNNLNKIAAILRISRDEKTLTPVNVSDFSKVKYVIVTESAITVVNNEGGSADASYYLIGDFNNWNTSNTDYNFTVDAANKKATATIPASAFSSNGADTEVYFAVNAIKNGSKRWYLKPGEKIDVVLGSPYAISSYNNEKNFSLCLKNPSTSATEIYTITLDFSSSNDINDSKLTITKSGSGGGETSSITFYVKKDASIYTWGNNSSNVEIKPTGEWPGYGAGSGKVCNPDYATITEVSEKNNSNNKWYKVTVTGISVLKLILSNNGNAQTPGEIVVADGIRYTYNNGSATPSTTEPIFDEGGEGEGGGDDDLTGFESGKTSNGMAYYLASKDYNLFNTSLTMPSNNTVKYNRILKFNDNGDGTYSIDIPATLTADLYIEEVDKENNVKSYYPTSKNKTISASVPANNSEVFGKLTTVQNYWAMTDRNGQNDGLYTIVMTLGKDGKPGKWSFKHNDARRVAYFLSTTENSSAYPVYSNIISSKFVGYNYFDPTGKAKYYIISNIGRQTNESIQKAKEFDNTLTILDNNACPTVNKLLLMGNDGQHFANGTSEKEPANRYKANEFSPNAEPMIAGNNLQGLCKVEYNPSNGDNDAATFGNRYGLRGQVILYEGGSAESSMTIVGPLVEKSVSDGTWDWTCALDGENVMKYNETENCYEITIITKKDQEGKEFRFVRDKNSDKSWGETGKIARIPYYDTTEEKHAATVADPNDVIIKKPGTDNILFNRPAGKWTIKFYLENHSDGTTTYYYTINGEDNFPVEIPVLTDKDGKRYVLRTFSYGADMTPTDDDVHIYVAHNFSENDKDKYTNTITGQVHLYEINYVPANTGVVLFCKDKSETQNVNFVPSNAYNTENYPIKNMEGRWTYNHSGETYNNDLQPVLESTKIYQSVFAEDGKTITARNFGLSFFSKTKTAAGIDENSYTDYIGFFRLRGTVGSNKAYLQYSNSVIADNAQIFGQNTDGTQLEKDDNATQNSKLAIIFEGFNDDNTPTGISEITTVTKEVNSDYYYNLQGVRVYRPSKGIYIHNGKKVVIK